MCVMMSGLKLSDPKTEADMGMRGQVETEAGLPEARHAEMALQTHSPLGAKPSAYF